MTLVSHAHGRERRAERGDQAAARRSPEPGAAEKRWRTHQGVVYITDETMRHEITSWRLDGSRARRRRRRRPAHRLHVVLVVDHSGDAPRRAGYSTRTAAVYYARAHLVTQGETRAAHLETPWPSSRTGRWTRAWQDLRKMGKRGRGPRYLLPALDAVLEVLYADAVATSGSYSRSSSPTAPLDHATSISRRAAGGPSGRMTKE